MDKRTAARTLLSSALARIAANSTDVLALRDAGRASIELDDYRAALGFLVRAEQANPRDGTVKAALGSAMVHMENPTRALDYFGEAQLLGAPERTFLSDRGLARDLLGQQDAAQRDYQLALSMAPNDETTRRYALSLGISGDADRAVQMLTPQLRAQDRGAWRLRAMILAMNGRDKEATEIVNATMPAALAQNIMPYLTQLDRLNPAQQAAAAHFGRFPEGNLGPKRKPVQVAAAPPAPASPAPTTGKRSPARDARRLAASTASVPARATPDPTPVAARPAPSQPAPGWAVEAKPQPSARAVAPAAALPTPSQPAPGWAAETKPQPQPAPAPGWAVEEKPSMATPAPVPAPTSAQVAGEPPRRSAFQPSLRPALESATLAQTSAAQTPAAASAPPPAAVTPGAIGVAMNQNPGPVGPGYSIADTGRPPAAPSFPTPTPTPVPASAAPLASLADIVGSIEIPPEELSRPDNAIGAATLAKLLDDKRRAEAAEAAKREKEAAAAKAKAEADAQAKAEAAKAKAEAAEKRASPARIWVQIAAGANARALATDYGKFAKKNPDLFKGKSGGMVEWGRTRRLLVGPFKDRKAAQDWLANYKKAGGDGLPFNSEAGQSVDPVK